VSPHSRQRSSIAAGRGFIARQAPELKPIEKLKYKITTKSPKEFRPPEPLLIANYSRLFQRPTPACSNTFVVSSSTFIFSLA